MAITKLIDFQNGAIGKPAYAVITSINLDYERKTANMVVKTYLNKATKESGQNPMVTDSFYVSDNNTQPGFINPGNVVTPAIEPVLLFSQYFTSGDTLLNAQNYLLTLDKFKDGIIVE